MNQAQHYSYILIASRAHNKKIQYKSLYFCIMHVPLIRVESGSDDLDYLGHFLVGQVGLIHKLIYLDVTQIFNRSHVL